MVSISKSVDFSIADEGKWTVTLRGRYSRCGRSQHKFHGRGAGWVRSPDLLGITSVQAYQAQGGAWALRGLSRHVVTAQGYRT
jgi:hypothetical protein